MFCHIWILIESGSKKQNEIYIYMGIRMPDRILIVKIYLIMVF